jgi:hypothetical protein
LWPKHKHGAGQLPAYGTVGRIAGAVLLRCCPIVLADGVPNIGILERTPIGIESERLDIAQPARHTGQRSIDECLRVGGQ